MDLPQSVPPLRHLARTLTVIPFPNTPKGVLEQKSTRCKTVKKPSWLTNVVYHWLTTPKLTLRRVKLEKILKNCILRGPELAKGFAEVKKETELEMLELFSFLKEVDIPAKMNLLAKFNQKIQSGEINSIDQMKAFLHKTEKLAECIKLYLRKNEYSENFTKEITFDVFEQGFNPKDPGKINKIPSNY